MTSPTTPTPKPEIFYLPALFRSIRAGEIRIPAFQRGFVWKPAQVLELLESVYHGFPIGSLLFWRVSVDAMQSDMSEEIPFPHPPVKGDVDFVLDGMQRISSLYGAFNSKEDVDPSDPFSIAFDLENEAFLAEREKTDTCIELRKLFNPRLLLEEQSRLSKLNRGDKLVDRTLDLQRIFQEYLVPLVRISNADAGQVVQIFERVNNTGTRLSAVDFMRALTWSETFDLTQQLENLSDEFSPLGFGVPHDTLAKVIALSMDIAPTGGEMLRLREKSASELLKATESTRQSIKKTIGYFQDDLGICNYDFIPYEGQFLVAASIASGRARSFPKWYQDWFWTVGFSESLQGRPDHAIARLALDARKAQPSGLPERFALSLEALSSRGIRKGAALGMAFVAMLATTPPYSVFTGKAIDSSESTAAFDTSMLGAVFDRRTLSKVLDSRARTDKVVCNVILLGPGERRSRWQTDELRQAIIGLSNKTGGMDSLQTQLIDEACIGALKKNDAKRFFEARGKLIIRRASELSGVAKP